VGHSLPIVFYLVLFSSDIADLSLSRTEQIVIHSMRQYF